MKNLKGTVWLGALLVIMGIVFLLQNFGLFSGVEQLVWVVLFGLAGLAFLWVFGRDREQWWAIIPGFTLLGLALLVGLGDRLGAWGGALFMAAIGLSFWTIYAIRREFWWAIIPGGALVSLAAMIGIAEMGGGEESVGIFFLGLAATFLLVYLAPTAEGRMKWALIPAGVLALMGALFTVSMGGVTAYFWPAALILAGAYLVVRSLMSRRG